MTKKLTAEQKESNEEWRAINDGINASLIISGFEKRYPSMACIFKKEKPTGEQLIEYQENLHRYAMAFKDGIKCCQRWLKMQREVNE